ncbi:MAG: hypothetical protein KGL39_24205 [Patescibacteria group bacterium]|nr:hypothetical protein [Patescibacteria group bacterium]
MATWQASNFLSGTPEGPKYLHDGIIETIWYVSLTTALANGDTILGQYLPANCFLSSVKVATDQLDTGGGITFTAGYASNPSAFITTSSVGQTGGIASSNVASALGFNAGSGVGGIGTGTNTQLVVTITHAAVTPKAGTMRLEMTFTASP